MVSRSRPWASMKRTASRRMTSRSRVRRPVGVLTFSGPGVGSAPAVPVSSTGSLAVIAPRPLTSEHRSPGGSEPTAEGAPAGGNQAGERRSGAGAGALGELVPAVHVLRVDPTQRLPVGLGGPPDVESDHVLLVVTQARDRHVLRSGQY